MIWSQIARINAAEETAERGREPQTIRQGLRWRCEAEGEVVNRTFFFGRRIGSRSTETARGNNQGHHQGEGRAGSTGTEEQTGFTLSTETESDLSPI